MKAESDAISGEALLAAMPRFLGETIQYVPAYNALYLLNPKAACSSLRLWLLRTQAKNPSWYPEPGENGVHHVPTDPAARLPDPQSDLGWHRVYGLLHGDAYVFSFVRHPISRCLSAYYDKIVRVNENPIRGEIQASLGRNVDPDDAVTFDDFLTALEAEAPAAQNNHWRPQHINVFHGTAKHALIGKVENFNADFARLCEESGMPRAGIGHEHKQAPNTLHEEILGGRSDRLRRIVKLYEADLEIFGYQPDR